MADTVVSDALAYPHDEGLPNISDGNETWDSAASQMMLAQIAGTGSYVHAGMEFAGHDGANDTVDVTAGVAYLNLDGETLQVQSALGGASPPAYDTTLPQQPSIMVVLPTNETSLSVTGSTDNDFWLAYDTDGTGPGSAGSVYIRHGSGLSAPSHPNVKLGTANPDDASSDELLGRGPVDEQLFTVSGTWNKPNDVNWVLVDVIGGGGAGDDGEPTRNPGGGAGARSRKIIHADDVPSSVSVTVGAGGTAGDPSTAGGDSSFGDLVEAFGGYYGDESAHGAGGGGGIASAGNGRNGGDPRPEGGGRDTLFGGGSAGGTNSTADGGNSYWGGGAGGASGGGSAARDGGSSIWGPGGGAGTDDSNGDGAGGAHGSYTAGGGAGEDASNEFECGNGGAQTGTAGTEDGGIPGGGGAGGSDTRSGGDGARGEVRVWAW